MEEMTSVQMAEQIVSIAEQGSFCPIHFPLAVFETFGETVAKEKEDDSFHWKIVMSYLMGVANAACEGHTSKRELAKHAIIDGIESCKENGVYLTGIIHAIDMPSTRSH